MLDSSFREYFVHARNFLYLLTSPCIHTWHSSLFQTWNRYCAVDLPVTSCLRSSDVLSCIGARIRGVWNKEEIQDRVEGEMKTKRML